MENDIVSNSNENVKIDDITRFVAEHGADDPTGMISGEATESRGKTTAGAGLSSIFSPFSISDNPSGFATYYTKAELLDMKNNGTITEYQYNKLLHLNKFWKRKYPVVSDENLPDDKEERLKGVAYKVNVGAEDQDSIRGIGINMPIWGVGCGVNSSGEFFSEAKAGPINMYYDEDQKIWEQIPQFPVVGKVIGGGYAAKPYYDIEVYGIVEDSGNQALPTFGRSGTLGNNKQILTNVYFIGAPMYEQIESTPVAIREAFVGLSSGEFVVVNKDYRTDSLICNKVGVGYYLLYNNTGEEIPEYSMVEIGNTYINGQGSPALLGSAVYSVKKPTAESLDQVIITDSLKIPDKRYMLISKEFPKIVKCSGSFSIGQTVGSIENSFEANTNGTGFIVVGISNNYAQVEKAAGGNKLYLYKATANASGGMVTAKKVDSNGSVVGEEETFYVVE